MAKKSKEKPNTPNSLPDAGINAGRDAFVTEVEVALDHFDQPTWLGEHSPLAAPYFLGRILDRLSHAETPAQRGQALQQVLRDAADKLDADARELLHITFFQPNQKRDKPGLALALHLSERSYYRYRTQAIQQLAGQLNQALTPPLRPELPQPRQMIAREAHVNDSLRALHERHSVCISGGSGCGKTTLGAAIVNSWGLNDVFWFTLRTGLNDSLYALVFALAYFLRLNGVSHTWRQVVADQGQFNVERILGLLRFDLHELATTQIPRIPLLCFDEINILQPELTAHVQIIHLLEALCSLVPVLLMGQRPIFATQHHINLSGFNAAELSAWLAHAQLPALTDPAREQLQLFTRGNPALLTVFRALHFQQPQASIETTLVSLANAASLEGLFRRLWRYLSERERELMLRLSVFRGPIPGDVWAGFADELRQLDERNLVQRDGRGGLQLLPHIQRLAQDAAQIEIRPTLHLAAAAIREGRGEYVEAMYHYIEGRQPSLAVWIWLAHRTLAYERGQAPAALGLLREISANDLPDVRDRDALLAGRGALLQFLGQAEEAEADLRSVSTKANPRIRTLAHTFHGAALEMQGRIDHAIEQYRLGLDVALPSDDLQRIDLRVKLSRIYAVHANDLQKAQTEALRARLESEIYYGGVQERIGHYAIAKQCYESALALVGETEGYLLEKSRAHSHLGNVLWRQGEADAAVQHLTRAIEYDELRGDVWAEAHQRWNLSAAFIVQGQYEQALAETRKGITLAEALQDARIVSGLASNAAEACFYLGQLDEAEHFAWRSLNQEDEGLRPYALTVLGMVRHAQNKFTEATSLLQEAIASAQAIEDKYAEAATWRALGNAYKDEPNLAAAREAYTSALNLYEAMGLEKEIQEIKQLLNPPSTGFQSA